MGLALVATSEGASYAFDPIARATVRYGFTSKRANVVRMRLLGTSERDTSVFANATGIGAFVIHALATPEGLPAKSRQQNRAAVRSLATLRQRYGGVLEMNAELASEFEKGARESVEECFKLGYLPTIFASMLEQVGAVATAKRLVASVNIQSGLRTLANLGRLDLSIESAMLEPKYSSLFSPAELKAVSWRLENFDKL